jgi:chemotaxis protein MotB
MAGKGGGAWKVAYADFVTAMMAFFMVMWLVGQDAEKKNAVAEYFQDPWAKTIMNSKSGRKPTLSKPKVGQTDPKKNFDGSNPREEPHSDPEAPDWEQPKLVTIREPDRSTAGTIVIFALGSAELDDDGRERLRKVIPQFVGLPHKIDIRGHVTPAMDDGANTDALWNLSYKRCLNVMHFLEDNKIDSVRLRLSVAGPHEPLALDPKSQDPSKNSRVEVFLLSETINDFQPSNTAPAKEESHSTSKASPAKSPAAKPAGKSKAAVH